jgi:hypothetical protein
MTGPNRPRRPRAPSAPRAVEGVPTIEQQRASVEAARRVLRAAGVKVQETADLVDELRRSSGGADAAKQIKAAEAALAAAQEQHRAAAGRLKGETDRLGPLIKEWVPDSPEDEVAKLLADRPIVLLPVRLETRFSGDDLLLRIYPDDVFADTHEPELTAVE